MAVRPQNYNLQLWVRINPDKIKIRIEIRIVASGTAVSELLIQLAVSNPVGCATARHVVIISDINKTLSGVSNEHAANFARGEIFK